MYICNTHTSRLPTYTIEEYIVLLPSTHFVALLKTNFSVAKLKDVGSLQLNGKYTCERSTSLSVEQGRTQ